MRKLTVFLFVMVLVFALVGMAKAEVILFEDFEDSSGFTLAGCVPLYWGIAPLSGTASYPSHFRQGSSSQDGNIFYGSNAKEHSDSPAATMTIVLPDLSVYTNLELTVALAAAEYEDLVPDRGIFEPTHRDSLHIIGATTISLPDLGPCASGGGCIPPVTGVIDSFLPITYPDDLRSNVHSIGLGHEFQDFAYTIDSSLQSLTFAFASTAAVEVVGIDSVKITGDPLSELPVALDIKPGSCPNPVNTKSKGVLPVAILGTDALDVLEVDVASIRLEGVAPIRSSVEDVSTPVSDGQDECDCTTEGPDGFDDLTLKFKTQEIIAALGPLNDGEVIELTLTGELFDGTPIEGQDCVLVLQKGK